MFIKGFEIRGNDLILHTTHSDALNFAMENDPFKSGNYDVRRTRKKRSLDANAYLWALCTKIANAVGISKEEVYRKNIREGGEFTPLPIKAEAIDEFSRIWASHGIGWFIDVVDNSKIPGYKLVFAYHGSSEYDTNQMSQLIERVKLDAESVGVETISSEQFEDMMKEWQ